MALVTTVQDILNHYYASLANVNITSADRSEIYYNIIYTKQAEGQTDIYLDTKHFLKNYIISVDDKNYGYDYIDHKKIIALVNLLRNAEQIRIWKFLKKLCVRFQCEEDWKLLETNFYKSKVAVLKTNTFWYLNPLNCIRFIYFKTVNSYWILLLLMLIVVIIDIVILLPNNHNWPSLFKITYEPISTNVLKNHIINVLLSLLEFDTSFKIIPINMFGTLVLLISKILKVIFVIQYLVDKIIKKINFDE